MCSPAFSTSAINAVTRASNSPLSFAPAINSAMSKDIIRFVYGNNNKLIKLVKQLPFLIESISRCTWIKVEKQKNYNTPREK